MREIRSKSLSYTFIFRTQHDGRSIEVARGSLVAVAIGMDPLNQTMKAVAIPQQIRAKLEVAPPEYFQPQTTA